MSSELSKLTTENLRARSDGPTREEREAALFEKMQTIAGLIDRVNDALDNASTTVPPSTANSQRPPPTGGSAALPPGTGSSSRPGTQRGQSAAPSTAQRGTTSVPGSAAPGSAPPKTGGSIASTALSNRSLRGGPLNVGPQLMVIHDDAPFEPPPVKQVQYTGTQTISFGSGRRKNNDAKAAQSSIGACFGGLPSSP